LPIIASLILSQPHAHPRVKELDDAKSKRSHEKPFILNEGAEEKEPLF